MNDKQIVEYLRSRGQATPPPDLAGSIVNAVERASQERRSWFAPFVPAAAVVGLAAAVLLVAALVTGQDPNVGPGPSGDPTPSTTPNPSPDIGTGQLLMEPGDVVQVPAFDSRGEFGSITVRRGDEVGGYENGFADDPDKFYIELFVEYQIDRAFAGTSFGLPDWQVYAYGGDEVDQMILIDPYVTDQPFDRTLLGAFPGAVDIMTTPVEGWLVFEVPREAAESWMTLRYHPEGRASWVAAWELRPPEQPAPLPVATPTPAPTPDEAGYVVREGMPFSVLDNDEANRLFETPDECTNPDAGYTVTFPDDWYTNTAIGDVPACSWFTPHFYTVNDPNETPEEIWISIVVLDSGFGYTSLTEIFLSEQLTVDGVPARRVEYNHSPNDDPSYRGYHYVVHLGPEETGPTLVASTSTEMVDGFDEYELARAVLDRIMATLEFD